MGKSAYGNLGQRHIDDHDGDDDDDDNKDDDDIDWVRVEFDAKCVAAPEICFLAKLFQIFPPIKFERFSAERQTPNIQTFRESNKCTHVS